MPAIRPEHIIITSNYSIDEAGFEPGDVDPIKRRFQEVSVEQFNSCFPQIVREQEEKDKKKAEERAAATTVDMDWGETFEDLISS